jgi:hypothetical protein
MNTPIMNIQAIAALDLVSFGFATIGNLELFFNAFIKNYPTVSINTLKEQLKNKFIQIFESSYHNRQRFTKTNTHYDITQELIVCPNTWYQAFKSFKENIVASENQKFKNFDHAMKNIPAFSDAISTYMQNFVQQNEFNKDLLEYTKRFEKMKEWIQNRINDRVIAYEDDHIEICTDFGYEYDAPTYWCCTSCQTRLKNTWIKRFKDFIKVELDQFQSAPLAKKVRYEPDMKVQRRNNFERRQMNKRKKHNQKYFY